MSQNGGRIASGGDYVGARDNQEDFHRVHQEESRSGDVRALCVLADGMGGHAGGAVASRIAVETFLHHFRSNSGMSTKERLRIALDAANSGIAAKTGEDPSLDGMGCTLIGAWKKADRLSWISVGDSPMWRYAGGRLERLNQDHSIKGDLEKKLARGEITQQEFEAAPNKHALHSALMGRQIARVDLKQVELRPGDRIVMASDGLETLSTSEIRDALKRNEHVAPSEMVDILIDAVAAKRAPRQDNTTVIVLDSGSVATSATLGRAPVLAAAALGAVAAVLALGFWLNWFEFGAPTGDQDAPQQVDDGAGGQPAQAGQTGDQSGDQSDDGLEQDRVEDRIDDQPDQAVDSGGDASGLGGGATDDAESGAADGDGDTGAQTRDGSGDSGGTGDDTGADTSGAVDGGVTDPGGEDQGATESGGGQAIDIMDDGTGEAPGDDVGGGAN